MGIIHFETFMLAGILLNLTPGNDTVFILSRSIAQGRRAGIWSVLGISTGSMVHTLMAALGLSVIIAQSALAFQLVKYAGAAYLLYIGVRMLLDRSQLNMEGAASSEPVNTRRIYREAVLTNVLNPKVALFFLAFLPQFIDVSHRTDPLPFILLGLTFTGTGTVWCLMLAMFSAQLANRLRHNPRWGIYLNRACGIVLIGLGLKLVMPDRQ